MNIRDLLRKVLASVYILAVSGSLDASLIERRSLAELRDQATRVVLATVVSSETRPDPQGRMVWTDYRIHVEETFLGPSSQGEERLSFAGGRYGQLSIGVAGVPILSIGGRYVFFLSSPGPFAAPTLGWDQGIFQLVNAEGLLALVSAAGETLEINPAGELVRGLPVRVENGELVAISLDDDREKLRVPDPVAFNADGTPARPILKERSSASSVTNRFATLVDLRRFLNQAKHTLIEE
jgi:hypothetical protein